MSRQDTPGHLRGHEVWLYCLTDQRRRVVKVGISANVPRRAVAICHQGNAFMRQWCHLSVPARHSFQIVRTWPLGSVSTSCALTVERTAHAALREQSLVSCGEWFHVSPRVAVPLVERVCADSIQREAA